MGSRADLDLLDEKKICCLCREFAALYHRSQGYFGDVFKVTLGRT